jgi:3-oxoacyl-[acyl-carrier-protein] synthase-1
VSKDRIAVTGFGAICSLGVDVPAIRKALITGKRGIAPLQHLDLGFPDLYFGEIPQSNDVLAGSHGYSLDHRPLSRTTLLALTAAREALGTGVDEHETTIISSSTVGGMDQTEKLFPSWQAGQMVHAAVSREHPVGAHTAVLVEALGTLGMSTTISTACSSSANAIIMGANMLRSGRTKRVLAGGSDALCAFTIEGFRALSAMDTKITRPFSNERAGMNLGEAAAYLVLERVEDALAAGRKVLAYYGGGANRNDAHHQTATSDEGHGPFAAMNDAITLAGIAPEEVDHINAHGTGTENNDVTELAAMERLFADVPPFTTTKALTGHTLAAAGALEAVISILCLQEGIIPVGHAAKEPITVRASMPVAMMQRKVLKNVLSNSFGFGGNDTALIFRSAD